MKSRVSIMLISIIFTVASMTTVHATIKYQWTQENTFSFFDDGSETYVETNIPITSSGYIIVSDPYPWNYAWASDVYSFHFAFTDSVGDLYSWDIMDPRVIDLEFYDLEGFNLDFHLRPADVDLLVSDPIHDGYSFVGDSGVPNVGKGTPEYNNNFQGINFIGNWTIVSEPISSILFFTGGTLLAGRRYLKRIKKA